MHNSDKTVHLNRVSVFLLFCVAGVFLFHVGTSYAQQTEQLNKVKAAYIYNFTKYIEFPEGRFEDASNDFNLCIRNAPEFAGLFESIEGVKIKDRDFRVKFISNSAELDRCHFLYVKSGANAGMKKIFKKSLKGRFLTISSEPGFVRKGGMIGFALVGNRVKVEINLESTRQAGFTVSARLLEVARVIGRELEQ